MNSTYKILIDNGHGSDTPGKRSPDGSLLEYKWAREIASKIVIFLKSKGYNAELLVPETTDISLQTRALRANNFCKMLGTSNVLLISIHINAAGVGTTWMNGKGWAAYTSLGKTKSDTLAEYLYDEIEKNFPDRKIRKDTSDGDRDFEANFYILKKTLCPAVLTENFFMDNQEECKFLLQESTKQKIVTSHVDGIINYILHK